MILFPKQHGPFSRLLGCLTRLKWIKTWLIWSSKRSKMHIVLCPECMTYCLHGAICGVTTILCVYCAQCGVQSAACSVKCAVCSAHCAVCTVPSVQCAQCPAPEAVDGVCTGQGCLVHSDALCNVQSVQFVLGPGALFAVMCRVCSVHYARRRVLSEQSAQCALCKMVPMGHECSLVVCKGRANVPIHHYSSPQGFPRHSMVHKVEKSR